MYGEIEVAGELSVCYGLASINQGSGFANGYSRLVKGVSDEIV